MRLAASGLGRGRQGLRCVTWGPPLQGARFSLVVAVGLAVASSGPSCPGATRIFIPGPGTEPTSPALEGRFLTAGLAGKSLNLVLKSPSQRGLC